jgi:hypothetical protein
MAKVDMSNLEESLAIYEHTRDSLADDAKLLGFHSDGSMLYAETLLGFEQGDDARFSASLNAWGSLLGQVGVSYRKEQLESWLRDPAHGFGSRALKSQREAIYNFNEVKAAIQSKAQGGRYAKYLRENAVGGSSSSSSSSSQSKCMTFLENTNVRVIHFSSSHPTILYCSCAKGGTSTIEEYTKAMIDYTYPNVKLYLDHYHRGSFFAGAAQSGVFNVSQTYGVAGVFTSSYKTRFTHDEKSWICNQSPIIYFTSIRNPWDRLISGFIGKVVLNGPSGFAEQMNAIIGKHHKHNEITFEELLQNHSSVLNNQKKRL